MRKKEKEIKKVTLDEIQQTIFEEYYDWLITEAKDIIFDGINFKGLNKMSRKELVEKYKELMYLDDNVEVVITK